MLTNDMMEAVFEALPNDLHNSEVASLLATIASAFSDGKDVNAAMHLNTAGAMVLGKMMHEGQILN